jgi:hypothetical protein
MCNFEKNCTFSISSSTQQRERREREREREREMAILLVARRYLLNCSQLARIKIIDYHWSNLHILLLKSSVSLEVYDQYSARPVRVTTNDKDKTRKKTSPFVHK